MAFTNDPTTDVGKVRLLIQDINAAAPLFTDEEITATIASSGGDTGRAAVALLRALARRYTLKGKRQIGDYSEDYTAQGKAMAALADALADELGDEDTDVAIGIIGGSCFLNW